MLFASEQSSFSDSLTRDSSAGRYTVVYLATDVR